jgi:hypothetical protein
MMKEDRQQALQQQLRQLREDFEASLEEVEKKFEDAQARSEKTLRGMERYSRGKLPPIEATLSKVDAAIELAADLRQKTEALEWEEWEKKLQGILESLQDQEQSLRVARQRLKASRVATVERLWPLVFSDPLPGQAEETEQVEGSEEIEVPEADAEAGDAEEMEESGGAADAEEIENAEEVRGISEDLVPGQTYLPYARRQRVLEEMLVAAKELLQLFPEDQDAPMWRAWRRSIRRALADMRMAAAGTRRERVSIILRRVALFGAAALFLIGMGFFASLPVWTKTEVPANAGWITETPTFTPTPTMTPTPTFTPTPSPTATPSPPPTPAPIGVAFPREQETFPVMPMSVVITGTDRWQFSMHLSPQVTYPQPVTVTIGGQPFTFTDRLTLVSDNVLTGEIGDTAHLWRRGLNDFRTLADGQYQLSLVSSTGDVPSITRTFEIQAASGVTSTVASPVGSIRLRQAPVGDADSPPGLEAEADIVENGIDVRVLGRLIRYQDGEIPADPAQGFREHWCLVETTDGVRGWIWCELLSPDPLIESVPLIEPSTP